MRSVTDNLTTFNQNDAISESAKTKVIEEVDQELELKSQKQQKMSKNNTSWSAGRSL